MNISGKKSLPIFVSGLLGLAFIFSLSFDLNNRAVDLTQLDELPIPEKNEHFGFNFNNFFVSEDSIRRDQFLADILLPHKVDYQTIANLAENAKPVFDVRQLREDKKYFVLNKDTATMADYFIYESNPIIYVVYDIKNSAVEVHERDVTRVRKEASGTITSSLWKTMVEEQGLDYELAWRMEDALGWSVSFFHIQKGDKFKAYYDELYVDDHRVGVGDLYAAFFSNSGNEYYAIKYASEKYDGFYDLEGRPTKKAFLRAPVKYSRISSRFNLRRFHPILKRVRAHLGTDYAAPYGTPIMAVSNGVVTKASRTKGNGNYVKIRHDKTYETQYLHMQRFAKGITPGVQVKQGQVIGYVGSTGLATGPHVCFRFWKNGRQVNFLSQNLPEPDPMAEEELPDYFVVRDSMKNILDNIPIDSELSRSKVIEAAEDDDLAP